MITQVSRSRLRRLAAKISWVSFAILLCAFNLAAAQEITLLYSGETHAMLYPCNCPREPDGGIARRATLIKQLREKYPDLLLVDCGAFFAGGLLDEYTQNTELDMQRTMINLNAMGLMRYDALAAGDEEFNFGSQFFRENISKTGANILSCNISTFKPHIIKEIAGNKIGIIGVTSLSAAAKAGGLQFLDTKEATREAVSQLKSNGVNIIVLLSHLDENEELKLVNDIKDIDVVIGGHSGRSDKGAFKKTGNTLLLNPSWQGRRLGKLTLIIDDGKIKDYKVEELRLWDKLKDDPDILSILPTCFYDSNCKKEGFIGTCKDAGKINSACLFKEANKIKLTVLTLRDCVVCETGQMVELLKKEFPGLETGYLYYPESKAAAGIIKKLGLYSLPAYILGKEAEKEENFDHLKANLESKGDLYYLKPAFTGISYLLNRKREKERLDLFISLYGQNTKEILTAVKEFNPDVHFIATEQENKFVAPAGNLEVEEDLRAVCIQKYYPQGFWGYISCRAANPNSSWWEDCAPGMDANQIKSCARGAGGQALLRENISLGSELRLMSSPVYLANNQEMFTSRGVPSRGDLNKVLKKFKNKR